MTWILLSLIRLYQLTLQRLMGGQCRFTPSCSQYAVEAVKKFGPWQGGWKALKRIARCHPWGGSGWDPV